MLKANELRIGNWVNEGCVTSVSSGFIGVDNNFAIEEDKLNSIPLTPEILDSLNAFGKTTKDGEPTFFNGDDIMIRIADMSLFLHSEVNGSVMLARQLRYVHELQNLYFALTGTELEINLNP